MHKNASRLPGSEAKGNKIFFLQMKIFVIKINLK